MATDKIAALRGTVLFGSLADEELRALAALAVERRLAREEVLFIAGEEARGLYVVRMAYAICEVDSRAMVKPLCLIKSLSLKLKM